MLEIVSTGSYYAEFAQPDDGIEPALQDLKPLVKRHCQGHYRRIDRFIQMSLIGAARCMSTLGSAHNTALYLGSGDGPMANNIQIQQQIFRDGQLPKPANFINTLSNSAGYYVARSLGLTGQNLFVSQGVSTLEALLQLVQIDLRLGVAEQALVGVTDECVLPLEDHRVRIASPAAAKLAEGSHWFLLRHAEPAHYLGVRQDPARQASSESLAAITSAELCVDDSDLERWLAEFAPMASHCYLAPQSHDLDGLAKWFSKRQMAHDTPAFDPGLGYYASRTAGAISQYLHKGAGTGLLTIYRDECDRYHVACIQTCASSRSLGINAQPTVASCAYV